MKIKKLMPLDAESRRLIDWMEKGEYTFFNDFPHQNCLATLLFVNVADKFGYLVFL